MHFICCSASYKNSSSILTDVIRIMGAGRADVMLWGGHWHCDHLMHGWERKWNLKVKIQMFPNISSYAQIWGFLPAYLYYETVPQDIIVFHLLQTEVSTRYRFITPCDSSGKPLTRPWVLLGFSQAVSELGLIKCSINHSVDLELSYKHLRQWNGSTCKKWNKTKWNVHDA